MLQKTLLTTFPLFLGAALLAAQDDAKLASGPQAGSYVPAPFECLNINGAAKGRQRCFVCQFALSPAVLVFANEPAEGKDQAFNDLLKKLDELTTEFEDRAFSVGVVILSPDARDSTNNPDVTDAKKLIDETVKRQELVKRLEKRAEPLKHAIMGCMPEAPAKYKLSAKAEVTILFYERLKIIDNWAFGPEQLQGKDVDAIVTKVRETLPLRKKAGQK
jgi:hypothetical protein